MDKNQTVNPEIIERRAYGGLVIEVELYKRLNGDVYTWPYIEKRYPNGKCKRHFAVDVECFPTKERAMQTVLKEGRRLIDDGFDPEQLG